MKIVLPILLYFFHFSIFSASFNCKLNIEHSKGEVKGKVLSFTFDSSKDNSKSLQLSDYRFLIWTSGDLLMLKIKGGELKKALSIQFALDQTNASFHYGENLDFQCMNTNQASSPDGHKSGNKSEQDWASLEDKVKVVVNDSLVFPYYQPEEVELMRTLYFQDKKVLSESAKLIAKLPWCGLRVQLARNEDTTVNKGEVFTPVSFESHNNNSYFTTYSYSFVDFSSGKKVGATRLYNPFMLNCNILRGMKFNQDTLQSIVGNYLKFI